MIILDTFIPHVNTVFTARLDGDESLALTLFLAAALANHDYPGKIRDPFQLRFRGSEHILLNQRIHQLSHAVLGEMSIFLVPIGHEDGEHIYQAVYI